MLGWRILKQADYSVELPTLSDDEEELIVATEERYKEATRLRKAHGKEESERLIEEILVKTAEEKGVYLDMGQQDYLGRIAVMHIYGFAFMEPLIKDPEIEEISVIGPLKPVYVYLRRKGWKKVNTCFEDERAITDMINRMARNVGRHITIQNPRLDAMLPDGSRLHGSLPPISQGEITIRKFRDRPYSPRELAENKTIDIEALALLSVLMQCDSSVVIAGNTASGKTTTLNALFSFVPGNERVVITEETPEINIPHNHQLRLVANKDMGISLKELVYDSLRMRPDRMIVGEVRNKDEVEALFDVLLAGQARGSYATLHARSVDEALSRLRSFGIRDMDMESMDCIVVQRRMLLYDSRKRRNTEVRCVVEIAEMDNGPKFLYRNGKIRQGKLLEKAAQSFGLSKREMVAELGRRKRFISRADPDYLEFYKEIQHRLYGG